MQSFRFLSPEQKALPCTNSRFVAGVLSQATVTVTVKQRKLDMQYAVRPKNRPAASVVLTVQLMVSKTLQVLQVNVQKQREVQHNETNDTGLKE